VRNPIERAAGTPVRIFTDYSPLEKLACDLAANKSVQKPQPTAKHKPLSRSP